MKSRQLPDFHVNPFSRTLRPKDCPGVTVSNSPGDTLAALEAKPGKDIWLFGGGSLFRSLLDLGIVRDKAYMILAGDDSQVWEPTSIAQVGGGRPWIS